MHRCLMLLLECLRNQSTWVNLISGCVETSWSHVGLRTLQHRPAGASDVSAWREVSVLGRIVCFMDVSSTLCLPSRCVRMAYVFFRNYLNVMGIVIFFVLNAVTGIEKEYNQK